MDFTEKWKYIVQQARWVPWTLLLICLLEAVFFEKIPFNNGLGWDGSLYGQHTKEFIEMFQNGKIDSYRMQRDLIPFILHLTLNAGHYLFSPDTLISDQEVICSFLILNTILIFFSGVLFQKIANLLQWSSSVCFVAFVFLFANFFILKMSFYYPVLMDVPAFFMAFLSLYGYLTNKKWILLFVMLTGFFVFPGLFLIAAILYVFPKEMVTENKVILQKSNWFYILGYILVMTFVAYRIYVYARGEGSDFYSWTLVNQINDKLFLISFAGVITYIGYILYWFDPVNRLYNITHVLKGRPILIVVVLFFLVKAVVLLFANKIPSYTIEFFFQVIGYNSVANPMTFLVSHITYFGGVLFLLLLFFRSFITRISRMGVGFELVVFFYLFLMIDSESRQLVPMLPFIGIGVITVLEKQIPLKWSVVFLILNLLISKIWYIIGLKEVVENGFLEFPFQNYFMNQGPWMSTQMYYVHLALYVLIGVLLFWSIKKAKERILANK